MIPGGMFRRLWELEEGSQPKLGVQLCFLVECISKPEWGVARCRVGWEWEYMGRAFQPKEVA